jgi:predicted  nucleic acid-binding Zn-ribbon protein
LNDFPIDRLRFEHEKRQREISNLQMQNRHIERQIDQLQQEWNEAYEAASNIHTFDAGGYQSGQQAYYDEIGDANTLIRELESEIEAIEQALNSKWK